MAAFGGKKLLFVADFDGTLTKFDTTDISFRACRRYLDGSEETRTEMAEVQRERSNVYLDGYSKCFEDGLKRFGSDASSPEQKSLVNFSASLDSYNHNSRVQIANDHLLDDIVDDKSVVAELCRDIVYQDQALETLRFIQHSDKDVVACSKILSVNWFKPVLVECLDGIIGSDDIVSAFTPILRNGILDLGHASTSIDKRNWIRKWKTEECFCVYVGDSMTDLLALLEADFGILVGKNRHVLETAKVFDLDLQPLSKAAPSTEKTEGKSDNGFFYADSWSEIMTFSQTFFSQL